MIEHYQTIPDLNFVGRMNTPEEFDLIGLPKDLTGKDVLDIGCNEGAFSLECYKRGAGVVMGVEPNTEWRVIANGVLIECGYEPTIFPDIDRATLKADLVLLLSILHVCGDNPQDLFDKSWSKVADGGLMIVEINDRLQKIPVKLPDCAVFFGKNKDNRSVWHLRK